MEKKEGLSIIKLFSKIILSEFMYELTEEGKDYLKDGLPEKQLLKFLETDKPMAEVIKLPKAQIAIGWARKNKWIAIENGVVKLTEEGRKALKEKIPEEKALEEVDKKGESESEIIKVLLSRNLIEEAKEVAK